jgi:hypothetical protein
MIKMKNTRKPIVRQSVQSVPIEFRHATAKAVSIAGTFNDWKPEASPMVPLGNGRWHKDLVLTPGVYEYRLVVNGDWLIDPWESAAALNSCGALYSVLEVTGPRADRRNNLPADTEFGDRPNPFGKTP